MIRIAAIVLAAGRATRFSGGVAGATKLTAEHAGKPLVRHAAEAALGAGLSPVVVVTGHARAQTLAALEGLDFVEAHNAAFAQGIALSLRTGLDALPDDVAGVVVLLGDMPRVSAALTKALVAAFRAAPRTDAVAPAQGGRRGNPVLLARSLFSAARALDGDEGARRLLRRADVRVTEVAVDDAGAFEDIDTPEQLARLGPDRP